MATTFTAAEQPGVRVGFLMREARAAAVVFAAIVAVSALAGVVWGFLAPAEQLLVVDPDRGAALTGESAHRFDAVAIFVLIGLVTAVLTAAAGWRWRRARGPLLLLGLLGGSALGSSVMRWVGEAVAQERHTRPPHPAVHTIVEFAPTVEGWPALLVQPLVAALVVLILAALSTTDDLGTGHHLPFGENPPEPADFAPGQFGSDITYGPYDGTQPFGPRAPVVPFSPSDPVPETDRAN
ncbi:MAG: hypothetical protein JWN03_2441 [Nocardia sp.]|uniref:DUF2567 domain-containing protein n=1 Tax=Nocardia sp. TaxID=1821 RepID=UPI0026321B7A|nr:DUF2567 domain-containing protein [Nocardia sp.]MCU1642166.1 hypothetical protein [Nocardia sp.]